MELEQYYIAFLRKGPTWSPKSTPEVEETQKAHLAHLAGLRQAGQMALAGPVSLHGDGDIRGSSLFRIEEVGSVDALRALVEADPAFKSGRLVADYMTWYVSQGSRLSLV